MLTRNYNIYTRLGYSEKEAEHLMLLEYRGIGFYPFRKEIEYILQVIKQSFERGLSNIRFDVNSIPGCNIPYAEAVIISVDDNFYGVHGEYNIEHNMSFDENGIVIPKPDNDPNYDNVSKKLKEAFINIHLAADEDGKFSEMKYRQTLAHELVHLRDDYEIRKSSNNSWSLLKVYVEGNVDIEKVMSCINNHIANVIYRLFIDTKYHDLGSQMYMDMLSLYKDNGNKLIRSNAHNDIKNTETMKEYNIVKSQFNEIIDMPMFANKAIVFFPKWLEKAMRCAGELVKKKAVLDAFYKDFVKRGKVRLNDVFTRIIKAAGTLYDDIEDKDDYTFEGYIKKSIGVIDILNENLSSGNNPMGIPENESVVVFAVNESDDIVPFDVNYNTFCFEKVIGL